MKKKLKPSGNGWELYFSKQLLKLLGYNPKTTKILITSKENTLYFKPVNNSEKFKDNMIRKFQKSGSSYGIYFPLELIEVLEIDPNVDFINVDINEDVLIIKKNMD